MKTKNTWYLVAMSAAGLSLAVTTGVGQVFSYVDALNNHAVANSPRAIEAFPWLAVKGAPSSKAPVSPTGRVEINVRRTFLSAPRVLEQFPELARPAQASDSMIRWPVIKNRAYASS